eukprot:4699006-Amphidinium_carterae.1
MTGLAREGLAPTQRTPKPARAAPTKATASNAAGRASSSPNRTACNYHFYRKNSNYASAALSLVSFVVSQERPVRLTTLI